MGIKVLVFGPLTDIIRQQELDIVKVRDTEELLNKLKQEFPEIAKLKFAIAVNKKIIQGNTSLNDSDSVALLPAFSGG